MCVHGVEGTVCACDSTSGCNNPEVSVCVGGSVCVCMGWRAQCAPVTVQADVTSQKVSV